MPVTPSDEINECLTILLSGGELDGDRSRTFELWLAESAEHRTYVEELRSTWDLVGQRQVALPGFRQIHIDEPDRPRPTEFAMRRSSWRGAAWVMTGIAAAVAAVVSFQAMTRTTDSDVQLFATDAAETLNVRLEDGTMVQLAPDSRLEVTAGSQSRNVRLQGRAFFAVTHDRDRPFRVNTTSGDVEVLGTRFEVNEAGDRVDLMVVDGRVALSSGTDRVEVNGGEASYAVNGSVVPAAAVADVYAGLEWMGRSMMFNTTPLHRVAEEIEHRLDVSLEVDASLREHTVTAMFRDRPLPDVLDVLCGLLDAMCMLAPDGTTATISAR